MRKVLAAVLVACLALAAPAGALDLGGPSGGGGSGTITGGTTAVGTCGDGRIMYDNGGVVGCDAELVFNDSVGDGQLSFPRGTKAVPSLAFESGNGFYRPSFTGFCESDTSQADFCLDTGTALATILPNNYAYAFSSTTDAEGTVDTRITREAAAVIRVGSGIEFTESDTNQACAAGNFGVYADTSEAKLKKCENGVATDLDTATGSAGGDLTGTYPNPTIAGNAVALATDTTGDYVASIGTGSEGASFTKSGNTTVIGTTSGTLTSGNGLKIDSNGNIVDSGGPFAIGGGSTAAPVAIILPNAGTTGTTANKLAKIKTDGTLVVTATTDVVGAVGPVIAGAGTTGSATVLLVGQASCVFDGATTAGDFVGISSSTAGDCTDLGSTFPDNKAVIGIVTSTNGSGGTYSVIFSTPDIQNTTNIKGGQAGKGQIGDFAYSGKLNITGIVAVSSSASIASGTRIESCTSGASAITRTLPAATGSGRVIDLVKIDSGAGTCIFGRTGSDTLNGATTRTLSAQYKADTCIDIASALWLCRGDGT